MNSWLMSKGSWLTREWVEILYANLYRGLGMNPSDLSRYETLLVGFNGKILGSSWSQVEKMC